jgi:hypothetical protein
MAHVLNLPNELRLEAERWLDGVDRAIGRLEAASRRLEASDALSLITATADVTISTAFARRMLSGLEALGSLADARWAPIAKPSRELAVVVHAVGDEFARTPVALLQLGKSLLPTETFRAFSLEIAYVIGSIFTNLTRAIWEDYPEYAPPDWARPA